MEKYIVLRTPPYHSDLQPIEFIWAMLKRWIADHYSSKINLNMLEKRIGKGFQRIYKLNINIDNMINHFIHLESELLEKLTKKFPNIPISQLKPFKSSRKLKKN